MEKLSKGQSALAQGAERFADVARNVKAQQMGEPPIQSPRMSVIAPGEAWSKKYMNLGIGPVPELVGVSNMTPMPHTTFVIGDVAPPRIAMPEKKIARTSAPADTAPMSLRIGKKDERKRSWLGRLLRGN
ncbi:MAG TPA: hypothetical protein VLW75_03680 [Rhizomicrobium sp.]|nr:hypothetical protein [Rhizomicrobium sp.]